MVRRAQETLDCATGGEEGAGALEAWLCGTLCAPSSLPKEKSLLPSSKYVVGAVEAVARVAPEPLAVRVACFTACWAARPKTAAKPSAEATVTRRLSRSRRASCRRRFGVCSPGGAVTVSRLRTGAKRAMRAD